MEDSGYLARAAFIMDRVMHRIGLHGKSFIPLVMGFGCNVPAIMATRTIESRSSRLITVLITPLHVVQRAVADLHPFRRNLLSRPRRAGALRTIPAGYRVGGGHGAADAAVPLQGRRDAVRHGAAPYRMPTMRVTLSHMWDKSAQYLRKMGGLILVASLFVWFLSYFPVP